MSDDESTFERTRMMNRYLYGSASSDAAADDNDHTHSPQLEPKPSTGASKSNSTTNANPNISDDQRFRSKSHESSRSLRPGIMRIKNKEIERGVRI